MFQIHVILITVCTVILPVLSEIRYNRIRGPPAPPRPPHPPQYVKSKWPNIPNGPRFPNRNYVRPIPIHMASQKQPVVVPRPYKFAAPIAIPQTYWKNQAHGYRPPIEKPFLTAATPNKPYNFVKNEPAIPVAAPTITNTIRQVGERGPIHTIPAPNLSPADKPAVIREELPHKSSYRIKEQLISPNAIPQALPLIQQNQKPAISFHQYQVNEFTADQPATEKTPILRQHPYYAPDPDPNVNLNLNLNPNVNPNFGAMVSAANIFPQTFGTPQPSILAAQHNIVSPPGILTNEELLQIINSIPQQHLVDSYGTPLIQQPQLQQHFMQQAHQSVPIAQVAPVENSQPLFQPEIHDVPEIVKQNFKPQFHTFNYVEQDNKDFNGFAQSRVTGDYTIEPETSENNPRAVIQSPSEALAQTQYVQQYFTNNDDVNNVENEVRNEKEATRIFSQFAQDGEVTPNMFYSSLPNREAAEALARLQAAGNIKSNLMKITQQNDKNQMRIFVPDEEENEDMETSDENEEKESVVGFKIFETFSKQNANNEDATDYSSQQVDSSQNSNQQIPFGNKLKLKNDS